MQALYQDLQAAIDINDFQEVLTLSEEILKKDQYQVEAMTTKVIALIHLKQWSEAQSILVKNDA